MKIYIKIILLLFFGLTSNKLFSQEHPIYAIEKKLMQGDKTALKEIAEYFNSNKRLIEFLGYHRIETTERQVAIRFIEESCLFTEKELSIKNNTKKSDFLNFINKNFNEIKFSNLVDAFLITPIEERTVRVEFRELTEIKSQELQNKKKEILNKEWVKNTEIGSLLKNQDSKCLLLIASELFKIRYRFNLHHFDKDEYTNLFNLLTNIDIGVENDKKEIIWHIDKDFYPEPSLNLLIYIAKNYKDFKWNVRKNVFENTKISIAKADKETALFQLLSSDNDTIALNAFTQLTNCNPEKVIKLADEYQKIGIHGNYAIPTFPYRFLKQLVKLVSIYKQNDINYNNNVIVKQYMEKLKTDLPFKERRNLENEIISQFSLNDISSFEYWALINGNSWRCTYSAGRILDIFYSNHFEEILNNPQQLNLYLKKTFLFDNLGIIGICNNYLIKFTNIQEVGIEKLNKLQETDKELISQIKKAKEICKLSIKAPHDNNKVNHTNKDFHEINIKESIKEISKITDNEKMENYLTEFLSKIAYNQIGEAMQEIENIEFEESKWKKYSFLERDFGFFIYGNFDTIPTRKEFLADYNKFSEFDFYKNMLTIAGTNYFNENNQLDYDKIYDALKYNVVVAFVGGGGGRQDNEVYAIIKLLELTYKTTLGYPKKLCNSNGTYGCDPQDRANYWMQYLAEKKLLKKEYKEAVSFHYE